MLDSFSFSRSDMWRRANWRSRPKRYSPEYCILARLKIVDKDFWIEGAVLSLSNRAALFRESSIYLLRRQYEEVLLEIEGHEFPARIASTDVHGYRLDLFELIDDSLVSDLQARWRIVA